MSTATERNRWPIRSGSSCAAGKNWIALTKDRRIRYRPAEIAAIRSHNVKAFVLPRGSLTAAEQAHRFIANEARITEMCLNVGPFVVAVHLNRVERLYPR
jgi:PIN like domain